MLFQPYTSTCRLHLAAQPRFTLQGNGVSVTDTTPPANTILNFDSCFLAWPRAARICCCCVDLGVSVSQKWTNRTDSLQTAVIYTQVSPGADKQVNKAWQRWGDTLSANCCPSLFKYTVSLCITVTGGCKSLYMGSAQEKLQLYVVVRYDVLSTPHIHLIYSSASTKKLCPIRDQRREDKKKYLDRCAKTETKHLRI